MLAPGDILQRGYAIEQRLGYGGVGAVYRARHIHLNRPVAIKFTFAAQPDNERMFEREAQVLAGLKHPALPGVIDYFEEGGCYYLVMEYIPGENLHTYLGLDQPSGQCLGEAETLNLITPVLDAIEYMHHQNPPIIHRDIKPRNIVITPENKVYLVDFGLAKAYEAGRVNSVTINHITPGYSPPEQYSRQTDMCSDLYSVGATLYTMLTGTIPPDALSLERGIELLLSLRDQNPNVSARLEDAILQLMTLNPIHRQRGLNLLKPIIGETVRNHSRPFEPALGETVRVVAQPLSHAAAHFECGQEYAERGAYDQAIAEFTAAIELQPNYADAYTGRGWAYFYKNQKDTALANFKWSVDFRLDYTSTCIGRGDLDYTNRNHDAAITDFTRALDFMPDYAIAYTMRGLAYHFKGDYTAAIADFTQALDLEPDYANTYNNRGWSYHFKGDYTAAIADFTQALDLNPHNTNARKGLKWSKRRKQGKPGWWPF